MEREQVWVGASRAGGQLFWWGGWQVGRALWRVGTWRYFGMTRIWTDPMRTVLSKVHAHGQKSWRKETPLGEKETPLGKKSNKVGENVNFVGEKITIVFFGLL